MGRSTMITPDAAANRNDKIHEEQLAAAEKAVDKLLADGFSTGRPLSIDCNVVCSLDCTLRKRLMDKYRAAGWDVKEYDDQRDGLSYTFSAK
jgi:hypothetical protein